MRTRSNNPRVNHSLLTTQRSSTAKRAGFTLVELLVVIGIIIVLIGLTTAAAIRIRLMALVVKNRHNITQMATSIQAFTAKTSVDYIPSRIVLYNNLANYATDPDPVAAASLQYLKKVWPRLSQAWNAGVPATDPNFSLGWCPDDPAAATPAGLNLRYELEGDQCIVFFLGGMQRGGASVGFASNKSNPTLVNAKTEPPFMEFPTPSLIRVPTPATSTTRTPITGTTLSAFLSFIDPYDTPYVYFSSRSFGRRLVNGNPGFVATRDAVYAGAPGYCRLDCWGLAGTYTTGTEPPAPLFELAGTTIKFYERDGFQIFSAGHDQRFGSNVDASGASNPYDSRSGAPFQTSAGVYAPFVAGHDDLTNFHPTILGAGR